MTTPQNVDTQGQRRVKYGINVAIAIVAAVAVAMLVNWISYRNFRTGAMRWDLTSTRQYSLSPLTRKVLDRFEGEFQLVTLFDASDSSREDTQRARDLIEEYMRASSKVKAQHIIPATELTRYQTFEEALHDRFKARLEPLDKLNEKGLAALKAARTQLLNQQAIIADALKDKDLKEQDPRRASIFQTERFFRSQAEVLGKAIETIGAYKTVPKLPNYSGAFMAIREVLEGLDVNFYPQILKSRVTPLADDSRTPMMVQEGLMNLRAQINASMAQRKPLFLEMGQATNVPEYDALLTRLTQPNPLVIIGPDEVMAINLNELFRAPTQAGDGENREKQAELEEKQFLGEERLTGIMARMTITQLKPPPMVVFVSIGEGMGSKPQRDYGQILDRLRGMNLRVETWEPVRLSPFVDPRSKPQPAPMPLPGQRAVWVLLPADPPDPQNPGVEKNIQSTITLLRDRLDQGDGLLAIVPPEVMPSTLETTILHDWAIRVDTHYVILRQVVDRFGQNRASSEHDIRVWPGELPVSKAISEAGMVARFISCSPITLLPTEKAELKHFPLVTLTGPNLWGNINTGDEVQARRTIEMNPGTDVQADSFTIAMAAQRPAIKMPAMTGKADEDASPRESRLVIVTDPVFATDQFGAANFTDPVTNRVRQMTPFQGNHELFVNSVYWLAGIEELIAASARTQDVRRVGALTPSELSMLQWSMLIGMPLGTFIVGVGVWMTRRR